MQTVGEARQIYNTQLKLYNSQKYSLAKQKQELEERMKKTEDGENIYAGQMTILDLQYHAVEEQQNKYQEYMDQIMEQWNTKFEEISGEQEADAAKEAMEDMMKIMEVARRIMHGDQVPAQDEKKLMEFDSDLYQMAKNAGALAQLRERKKYDSLWEDEEKEELEDPMDAADAQEVGSAGPEVISVEETMATAAASAQPAEG